MVIYLGEIQVFKRKMAQALDSIVRREFPLAYLLEKFANGFGVQKKHSAFSIQANLD